MPREQRTSLNKTAVNEVPLGEFKSGVTKTVNMPTVAPTKSLGQSLAEGLNMVTKAATVYMGRVRLIKTPRPVVLR